MREADYVIVGAGTAGCVLADRLSEDGGAQVLLLEAGGTDRRPDVIVPGAASRLHRSGADWGFYTTPQPALGGRRVYVPRGKLVGGSGSTNTLIAIRGVPLDFDEWRDGGATGWGWDDLRPLFERIDERMPVRTPTWTHPLWDAFVEASRQRDLPLEETGFQREAIDGVGLFGFHVRDGQRLSTAVAYLRPARRRGNLEVRTRAQVKRLRIEGGRCTGVELRDGEVIRARSEVILAAGAIGSPQLLMLSGVGPGEHLKAMGIDVARDLPVGDGMQDHPILHLADACREPISVNTTIERPGTVMQWLLKRDGMLAWPLPGAGGFLRTVEGLARPDIQLHFVAGWARDPHDYEGRPMTDGYLLGPTLCKPRSRGRLRLASPFAHEPPAIDPALLDDPEDVATLVRGYRVSRRILDAPAFDRYRGEPLRPDRRLETDAEIEAFLRAACMTTYHPSCTCRIGHVVDPALRVLGVEGLRVVDASVMPSVTTANTNLPTIAIAEKAADHIREG